MKKLTTSIILSLLALTAIAQSVNERTIGKNLLNGTDIVAKEYAFSERIYDYYIDTTTNCITLQLRGISKNGKWMNNTGSIILYDLVNNREKWTQKINYVGPNIRQFNSTIISPRKGGSYCLDAETGKDIWEVKNTIYYVDPDHNIGLGYSITKGDLLQGVELENGKTIWSREISRDYGWNSLKFLNDSTALITAAGLHTVNLKDGTGWDYNSVTGKKDYTATAAANAAGAVLGILTGTFAMTTGHSLVRDLASNTLISDENIYFADTERISCFDYNGNNKWMAIFDKDAVSKSNIFLKGDTLYMVNLGYAFMGDRRLNYGIPFITAYNRNSGESIFMTEVGEKKSPIRHWDINGYAMLLAFDDKIVKYSLNDGSILLEKSFEGSVLGQLTGFVGASNYIKNGAKYESMVLSHPENIYAMNSEKVIVLNNNFEVIGEIEFDQIYGYYLKTDKYRFLAKGADTIVIDDDNNEVAAFEASRNAFLAGNKLYQVKDNTIIELDITEFL